MVQVITKIILKTRMRLNALMAIVLLGLSAPALCVEEDPEIDAQFREGMEALKDERLKAAIRAFSKILDAEPELHRARLELALAYYRSMRYQEADRLAREVLDDPETPPEVRVTILAFLAQVKRDSEQFGQKHSFRPFLSAGIMRDSNVNVGPTVANIRIGDVPVTLTEGSLKRSDNAVVVNAGIDHLYQSGRRVEIGERTGMLVWQNSASVYSREYHEHGDFDLQVASLNTGPAVLMLRHWRASLELKSDYLTIGGGYLAWFNSINPSITWQFNSGEVNWDAIYTRRFYHRDVDSGREGDYMATGVTLGRYFANRRIAVTLGGRAINFMADDDEFGYLGSQVSGGISTDTYRNGSAYARQRVAYFGYEGDDTLFQKEREDWEYRTTAGLVHEFNEPGDLLKNWVASVFYERTRNNSNIGQLYSYRRNQWMLMLSRNF